MTSIVITPFDPEHAEELKAFIENEIANADFEGEDMPSFIRIEDVTAIKRQRDLLLAALQSITECVSGYQRTGHMAGWDKPLKEAVVAIKATQENT